MPKLGSELVQDALDELMHTRYDAVKAHEYYMRTRKLKGRKKGSTRETAKVIPIGIKKHSSTQKAHQSHSVSPALQTRIHHLESRLNELRAHLRKLLAHKSSSSHKKTHHHMTVQQKQKKAVANKNYRQSHKTQLANKRKSKSHGGGGGGGSSSTPISSMTEAELRSAIKKTSANLHAAVAKARAAANRGTA